MVLRCLAAAVAAALLLAGCVPTGQEESSASPSVETQFAIPYTHDPADVTAHTLDFYPPTPATSESAPLIVWTGGNGWLEDTGGGTGSGVAALFGPHGYAVAGVNIRSSAEATFPGQVEDLRAAIHFLRRNADRYRIDPDRIGVAGDSSGGWTALMVALTTPQGDSTPEPVGAALAMYAPVDFLAMDRDLPANCRPDRPRDRVSWCQQDASSSTSRMLGCALPVCPPALLESATPSRFVDADDPPVMLVHGTLDELVPWQQSTALFDAITAAEGRAELILVPRGSHGQAAQWAAGGPLVAGATLTTTDGGTVTGPAPVTFDGDVLVDFFDRTLG
ncbi:alpha/beta hydrolase fold domain-containing protein [Leifsonia poae]|uniref:alpha/beta hydrolase fold domain-containing protein n=1 Tax=Leifsonia poae TaxID=110933 RepID=UPI003D69709A